MNEKTATHILASARKDRLFNKLAGFLNRNCQLVADATDSNAPWNLLTELNNYKYDENERKRGRK